MLTTFTNVRKAHLVLWIVAGSTLFMFFSQGQLRANGVHGDKEVLENGVKKVSFKMQHCDCMRTLTVNLTAELIGNVPYNETTCSMDAYRRGGGQKIVGFSFYGDINSPVSIEKGYFEGIIGNLKLMPRFYPGWVMRLYFDLDDADPVHARLCELACSDTNIDICDAADLPGTPMKDATKVFAMNWRFFPTLDPQVDMYVSRDLDSRFSEREEAAVKEWIQSDKDFHFMRDHPYHGTTILGSGWGVKTHRTKIRQKWSNSWKAGFQDPMVWAKRNDHGPDQTFLDRYIWPWAKRFSIGHDSYLCKSYEYTQPFPTERKNEPNNFVASVVFENHTLWEECPEVCRPKDHKDWTHC